MVPNFCFKGLGWCSSDPAKVATPTTKIYKFLQTPLSLTLSYDDFFKFSLDADFLIAFLATILLSALTASIVFYLCTKRHLGAETQTLMRFISRKNTGKKPSSGYNTTDSENENHLQNQMTELQFQTIPGLPVSKSELCIMEQMLKKSDENCGRNGNVELLTTSENGLIFHQFPKKDGMAPCKELDGILLETLLRFYGVETEIRYDATINSGVWMTDGRDTWSGIRECLEYTKTLSGATDWFFPKDKRIPARFQIGLLQFQLTEYLRELAEYDLETPSREDKVLEGLLIKTEQCFDCLNASLAGKLFFIGNSATVIDCFAFACTSQVLWNLNSSRLSKMIKSYPNLIKHYESIRMKLWSDWLPPSIFTFKSASREKEKSNSSSSSSHSGGSVQIKNIKSSGIKNCPNLASGNRPSGAALIFNTEYYSINATTLSSLEVSS